MPFFEHASAFNINGGHFSDDNGNNAHLAPQSMRTRNGMYSPTQEYGIGHSYPRQYTYPSQFHYGANFQHQMHYQHRKGWCDPPIEYYPQFSQQATFNPSASPPPPPEYGDWANSRSQMTGYPSDNYQYGWHHHNAPYSPPASYPPQTSYPAANHQYMRDTPHPALPQTWYPPPAGPPPSQATSYPAGNNQYMGYHAPSHPGVSSSPPAVFQSPSSQQLPTTSYPSGSNQYPPYELRPSRSLAATTSTPPTMSLPPEPVRVPVQSPSGALPVNPAPVPASPSVPIPALVLPKSHPPPPTPTPLPSRAPVEQVSASQEFATVGVVAPAAVLWPADIKDTPQSPLPVDTVHVVHSNRPRQEEQPSLAAPRPLVAGALTNNLNSVPAAPSSAPPSANQALLSPATQRVEPPDALMPPSISPVSASTVVAELVPANNLSIPQSKLKVKRWRRMVIFIKRQANKFRKGRVNE